MSVVNKNPHGLLFWLTERSVEKALQKQEQGHPLLSLLFCEHPQSLELLQLHLSGILYHNTPVC